LSGKEPGQFSPSQPVLYWLSFPPVSQFCTGCATRMGGKIKKIKGPFYFFLAWITGRGEISPCTRGRVGEASAPVTMPGKTPETPVTDSPVQFRYLYYRHRTETLNFTGPSMTTPFPPVGVAGHRYPSGPVELSIPPSSLEPRKLVKGQSPWAQWWRVLPAALPEGPPRILPRR